MAERAHSSNVSARAESASTSNNSADVGSGTSVPAHLPRVQSKRNKKRTQESINSPKQPTLVINPVNFARVAWQSNAFGGGNPAVGHLARPLKQCYPFNIVPFFNVSNAVFQPTTSYNKCFHRPDTARQQQRSVHTGNRAKVLEKGTMNGLRFFENMTSRNDNTGFTFSVMSYNVLAQDLVELHPYLYASHKAEVLKWEFRWNNLFSEIKYYGPDILCLQEVQGSHIPQYYARLQNLGYQGVYKQRTGIRTDGCAIYYKPGAVTMVEHITVEYNQPKASILDRDNVAIIAKFAPKQHPNKEFVVATTHLLFNRRRQDVRLAQTQLLLAEIDRIAFKGNSRNPYLPTIMTGDLNSTPDSAVYKFITTGELNYEFLERRHLTSTRKTLVPPTLRITDQCQHAELVEKRRANQTLPRSEEAKIIELGHSERQNTETKNKNKANNNTDSTLFSSGTLTHKFHLESVYSHGRRDNPEGTTFQDEWVSVDYIFYSNEKRASNNLTLLGRYKLPTRNQLENVRIPDSHLGSDHLSLLAKFKLEV